jgi:hypothetical protein
MKLLPELFALQFDLFPRQMFAPNFCLFQAIASKGRRDAARINSSVLPNLQKEFHVVSAGVQKETDLQGVISEDFWPEVKRR